MGSPNDVVDMTGIQLSVVGEQKSQESDRAGEVLEIHKDKLQKKMTGGNDKSKSGPSTSPRNLKKRLT